MDFRQLTDSQCGQSNPLVQMMSHVTQDHTFLNTPNMPKPVLSESNSMPPQSFKMTELINEMNKLQCNQDSSIAMNHGFTRTAEVNLRNSSFVFPSRQPPPQQTYFNQPIPPGMYWPPQVLPQEMAQPSFMELPTYDKTKYIVIESVADLDKVQEIIEEPPEVQPEAPKPDLRQDDLNKRENLIKEAFDRLIKAGKECLANGNIILAVKCFDLATKVNKTSAEGWKLLGIAWTENSEISMAIDALRQGLSLEPHNLGILMALAECYANQENRSEAAAMLFSWLVHHPAYNDIIPANFKLKKKPDFEILNGEKCCTCSNVEAVQNMLIEAARRRPTNFDYEVQNALGLLLYANHDYDKAVDCFRAALQICPRDSRLWKRLAGTLSKLDKREEALNAYYRALRLDPNFVLCRYNFARMLMRINIYTGAAKHLVFIAKQQMNEQSNFNLSNSDLLNIRFNKIWWNLGLCIARMGRNDLETARKNMDIETLNKELHL